MARAQRYDVEASFKDLGQVCANIQGMTAGKADELLAKVERGTFPIWFKKHNKKMGHRGEIGGKKGRYPRKCAKIARGVLENAVANAEGRGLLGELVVASACANKQATYPRSAPRGRWRKANYSTTRIEIVLREVAEAKPEIREKKKRELAAHAEKKRAVKDAREKEEKKMLEQLQKEEAGAKTETIAAEVAAVKKEEKAAAPGTEEAKAEKALERSSMEQA